MPKLIKDAKKQILAAAREELRKDGAEELSMRSIAAKANVAVGTIYHYFPDKLNLIVGILYEDWTSLVEQARTRLREAVSIQGVCDTIVYLIRDFNYANLDTFENYQYSTFGSFYFKNHPMFINEIKKLWMVGKTSLMLDSTDEEDELISEMLIATAKSSLISTKTVTNAINKILNGGN